MFSPIAYVKFWILFIICLCFSSTGFSASDSTLDSINSSPKDITKAQARLSILQKEKDEAASKLEKLRHQHKAHKAKLKSLKHPHKPSIPSSLTPPLLHEEDHKKLSGGSSTSIPGSSSIVSHAPETLGSIVSKIVDVIEVTVKINNKIFRLTHKNQALIEKIEKLEGERKDLKEKSAKLAAYSSSASSSSSSTSAASLSHAPAPKPSSPAAASPHSKVPIRVKAPVPPYTSPTMRASQNRLDYLYVGSPSHEDGRLKDVDQHFNTLPDYMQKDHLKKPRRLVRELTPQPHKGAAYAPVRVSSAASNPSAVSASTSSTPLPETTAATAAPPPPLTNPFIDPSQIFSSHEPLSPSEEIMRPSTPPPFDPDELPS